MAIINIEAKIEGLSTATATPVRVMFVSASLTGHSSVEKNRKESDANPESKS